MKYTAGQAAKAVGVATATITRALKSGKISGTKNESGAWVIDASELHRVFPPVSLEANERPDVKHHATHIARDATPYEISMLERELKTLRDALNDAREDRDKWRDMAERLSLAPPASSKAEKKTSHPRWQFWNKS